jgi:hypothetical protein
MAVTGKTVFYRIRAARARESIAASDIRNLPSLRSRLRIDEVGTMDRSTS